MDRQGIVDAVMGRLSFWRALRQGPRRTAVPIRIYVAKGTGSSSVTRLVAAGLTAGGLRTCAKTSTTSPRLMFPDGREYPVYRPGTASAREQRRIITLAERERAEVLVLEGLAETRPAAVATEIQLLAATHVVVPGDLRTQMDRAKVTILADLLPNGGKLFATEAPANSTRGQGGSEPATDANMSNGELEATVWIDDDQISAVSWDEMERFSHVEYREHVAVALRICAELGVDRDTALRGMWQATPDPGVATVYQVPRCNASQDGGVTFINGFAVSDPSRLRRSWEIAAGRYRHAQRLAIVNCRADRPECWRTLADSLVKWTPADHYLVIGSAATLFAQRLRKLGVESDRVTCTRIESAERIGALARRIGGDAALVLGVGSMSGSTWALVNYFRKNQETTARPRALGSAA